jgi:hypothetical protein
LDLASILEIDPVDIGRHQIHNVISHLEVTSDSAIYKTEIYSSATKNNYYRLPHTIIFERDGFVHSDSIFAKRHRAEYREAEADPKWKELVAFEYDLFVDNPFETYLDILEVYPSAPSLVTMKYWHKKGRKDGTDEGYDRFNNCGFFPMEILHCNRPATLETTGPLSLAPGASRVYIGTVALNSDVLTMFNEDELFLGYLHFATEDKFFSIALEFISDGDPSSLLGDKKHIHDEVQTDQETSSKAVPDINIVVPDNSQIHNFVAPSDGGLYKCDVGSKSKPIFASEGVQQNVLSLQHAVVELPQTSKGQLVDFGLVTSVGDKRPYHVTVTNTHDIPIRIMHQKFSFDRPLVDKNGNLQAFQDDAIDDDDDLNNLVEDYDESETILPGQTMDNVGNANVHFIGFMSPREEMEKFHGTLILRFGPANMTHDEWKEFIRNDPELIQKYVVELPLIARTIRGQVQYDISRSIFPTERLDYMEGRKSKKCVDAFDRKFAVMNQFPFPLTLNGMYIQGTSHEKEKVFPGTALSHERCTSLFEVVGFEGNDGSPQSRLSKALPGKKWGDITIRYKYSKDSFGEHGFFKIPRKCSLVLYTPEAGQFHLPLWIYKGEVVTTTEVAITPPECLAKEEFGSSLSGFDCLDAIQSSGRVGSILSSSLRNVSTNITKEVNKVDSYSSGEEGWIEQINDYYSAVASDENSNHNSIHPVILSFGIISAGAIDTHSMYIKNKNPVPVDIRATVSAVEGMEVRLARVAVNIKDYIKLAKDNAENDELSTTKWLRQYLMDVKGPARDYLQSFTYRDDISLMTGAPRVLQQLFHNTATVRLHRPISRRRKQNANGVLDIYPPGFQQEVFPKDSQHLTLGPMLVTLDDSAAYPLMARNNSGDAAITWTIPPGGVARLEVTIRAPSKIALHNRAFAEILTTGIVLRTSVGQVIPIVATYKTLSGTLEMNTVAEYDASSDSKVLPVPAILRPTFDKYDEKGPKHDGLEVSVHNTLTSDILLKDIESCNKWFQFDTVLPKRIATDDNHTAVVRASFSCDTDSSPELYPSFYHCALELLEKKNTIQSSTCGEISYEFDADLVGPASNETNAVTTKIRAVDVLKRAVQFMDEKYSGNETPNPSHFSVKFNLNRAKGAAAEWRALSKVGMNKIRGSIRARFELIENNVQSSPTITSTLSSKILESDLEFPYLANKINKFNVTDIGEVSELYVPISNPSGYPVRVRIVEEGNSPFYIHKARRKDPWWTGGAYYIPDDNYIGNCHLSMHNMTVQTASGSGLSMHSPSLHSTTAFSHGCSGRRCGFHFGHDENGNQHKYNKERRKVSPIGASASTGAQLTGRMYNRDGTPIRMSLNATNSKMPWFALKERTMREFILQPYASKEIGPFYFRPYAKGVYSGYLILENTLTGFEALRFQGAGSSGRVSFFDSNERVNRGGDIVQRYGKTALIFNDIKENEPWYASKELVVGNLGGMAVEIINVYLTGSHISGLYGSGASKKCQLNGFNLIGCMKNNNGDGAEEFVLLPTQSKVFKISHRYDSVFKSMYASLVVEYRSTGSSRVKKAELMLAREISDDKIWAWDAARDSILSSRHYRNKSLLSTIWSVWGALLPFFILFSLMWDIISNAKKRHASSTRFRAAICVSPRKLKSKKTGFKTWFSAYRCLARADPTSTELVQLGKEQTRQMLLNTYRKEEMFQPQCVLANGAFSRERQGSPTGAGDASRKSPRRQSNTMSMTLNDAIFSKRKAYQRVIVSDITPILPSGLGWRVIAAMRSERSPRKMSRSESNPKTLQIQSSMPGKDDEQKRNNPADKIDRSNQNPTITNQIPAASHRVLDKNHVSSRGPTANFPKKTEDTKSLRSSESKHTVLKVSTSPPIASGEVKSHKNPMPTLPNLAAVSKEASIGAVVARGPKAHIIETVADWSSAVSRTKVPATNRDIQVIPNETGIDDKIKESDSDKMKFDESSGAITSNNDDDSCPSVQIEELAENETRDSDLSKFDSGTGAAELKEVVQADNQKPKVSAETVSKEMKDVNLSVAVKENGSNGGTTAPFELGLTNSDTKSSVPLFNGKSQQLSAESANKSKNGSKNEDRGSAEVRAPQRIASPAADGLVEDNVGADSSPVAVSKSPIVILTDTVEKGEKLEEDVHKSNAEVESEVANNKTDNRNVSKKKERKRGKSKKTNSKPQSQDPQTPEKVPQKILAREEVDATSKSQASPGVSRCLNKMSDWNLSRKTLVSATSEESSVTNVISTPDDKPVIRPPPGLAPPPGFGGSTVMPQTPLLFDSPLQLHSEQKIVIKDSDVELLANVLDEKNALSLSPPRHFMNQRNDSNAKEVLGIGEDTNVMNFLTFLDETMEHNDEDSYTNEDDNRLTLGEETNYEPLPLYGGLVAGMSNNPWSDTARTPRAFAYGFGVENGGRHDAHDVRNEVVDSTLLTPALILGYTRGADSDDEQEKAANSFDADAFFSDLLE